MDSESKGGEEHGRMGPSQQGPSIPRRLSNFSSQNRPGLDPDPDWMLLGSRGGPLLT